MGHKHFKVKFVLYYRHFFSDSNQRLYQSVLNALLFELRIKLPDPTKLFICLLSIFVLFFFFNIRNKLVENLHIKYIESHNALFKTA